MATGFVCLELYKHLTLPEREMGGRRNLFANLALPGPMITLSEPAPCPKIKSGSRFDETIYMDVDEIAVPEDHTVWDHIFVPGAQEMTLDQFFNFFKTQYKLNVIQLLVGGKAIYSTHGIIFEGNDANKPRKLVDLIAELDANFLADGGLKAFYPLPQIMFQTLDEDDVRAASVVLQFS